MKKINVLVTGGGSPGIAGTIYSLKNNYDKRNIKVTCTDIQEDCVGRYLADKFYKIYKASDTEKYLKNLLEICNNEKIDVILPQNTAELLTLAKNQAKFTNVGIKIVVSNHKQLITANNKYELLKISESIGIPFPKYSIVCNKNNLILSAKKIGWPNNPVVVKPPDSNGSRGLRIIDENKNYKELFYNQKPTNMFTKFEPFLEMIGDSFDPLLLMEYLPGEEITIDVFRNKEKFVSIPRIRSEIRSGISFRNKAIKSYELINYSKILSDHLNIMYCFGYQFKYDSNGIPKILECNPRVQGTMVFSTFMGVNMIYSAIKSILNEKLPEFSLEWETNLLRYFGAIGITKDGIVKI